MSLMSSWMILIMLLCPNAQVCSGGYKWCTCVEDRVQVEIHKEKGLQRRKRALEGVGLHRTRRKKGGPACRLILKRIPWAWIVESRLHYYSHSTIVVGVASCVWLHTRVRVGGTCDYEPIWLAKDSLAWHVWCRQLKSFDWLYSFLSLAWHMSMPRNPVCRKRMYFSSGLACARNDEA